MTEPRPETVALLAAAMHALCEADWALDAIEEPDRPLTPHGLDAHHPWVTDLLVHPPLAAALALGIAWQEAVDALPDGTIEVGSGLAGVWYACRNDADLIDREYGYGLTPTDALVALTARLKGHD